MTIDRTSWWWRRGRAGLVIFASLFAAGIAAEPLQNAAWKEVRARQPELKLQDLSDNLSQGMLLGVFGGFRAVLADFVWLQGYHYWEQRDRPDLEAMIYLASTLDPRLVTFWDDGSHEIAYDIPAWAYRDATLTPAQQQAAYAQGKILFGQRAIGFLERGLQFHPGNYQLLMDEALIYQDENGLHDLPHAAEKWREAATAADSPFFAGRLYIRLLLQMGKKREAYDYLHNKLYPTLPADAGDAQKGVLWDWMVALEQVLKIPHDDRPQYAPPPGWKPDPDLDNLPELSGGSP